MSHIQENYDYKLIILGEPMAQKRHCSAIRSKKDCGIEIKLESGEIVTLYRKKDLFIHNYDPSSKDKESLRRLLRAEAPDKPLEGPLRVDLFLFYSRPNKHYGTGRNKYKIKDWAPLWKFTKPDRDNADKIVLDALEGDFWRNDALVCAGEITKQYSEKPRTEIYITKLDQKSDSLFSAVQTMTA